MELQYFVFWSRSAGFWNYAVDLSSVQVQYNFLLLTVSLLIFVLIYPILTGRSSGQRPDAGGELPVSSPN
jgi:hypothetical protein